ncbi:hypothetical protein N7468_006994 [Penicillium chermesinum]|uniref:F-box domain-containing protein n=1 Tax=Penicillium chermesinum TaxID=63820 RepID=A0A9W9TKC2_9EURO|nr:uncharacterized protein N7468_006994 [Penicillium chermesinum]KAJ5225769.1 hypothetical protein N7468_006994 [Penicillium chermesinum]
MDKLPVEILNKIFDLLTPREKVQLQIVSKRFFDLARDNNAWKIHCYEESWAFLQARRGAERTTESLLNPTATLSTLGQNSLRDLIQPRAPELDPGSSDAHGLSLSEKARAASDWDSSFEGEHVDWYSEYIARHGPMSLSWVQQPTFAEEGSQLCQQHEIKGMGLLKDWGLDRQNKIIAPLEDGSVCVWDLNHSHSSQSPSTKGKILKKSDPGILMATPRRGSQPSKAPLEFVNLGEGVSVDSFQKRAYLAVGNVLNEVDLETLSVISQQRFPWSIFALSQETDYSVPLTLATTLSLQIYDARLSSVEEELAINEQCEKNSASLIPDRDIFLHPDSPVLRFQSNGQPPQRIRSLVPRDDTNYAPLFQPGPLSILHPPAPHPSEKYCALRRSTLCTHICPAPRFPVFSDAEYPATHTIAACGEYNGRGSLELYSLDSSTPTTSADLSEQSSSMTTIYKNRQSAASSKLLSVTSHGNRLVYSDSEGNIKWVERDGRSEVRRWNINTSQPQIPFYRRSRPSSSDKSGQEEQRPRGLWASLDSEQTGSEVARKILPTGGNLTGDELLVWTGERIGRMKFSIPADLEGVEDEDEWFMHAEVDEETREAMRNKHRDEWENERRYEATMRLALERQADEVRWMATEGMS